MTTETETLEALHLWLAERLNLRRVCPCDPDCTDVETCATCAANHLAVCAQCHGRRWLPEGVTTDGLLEALRTQGISRVTIFMTDPKSGPGLPDRTRVHLLPLRGQVEPWGGGDRFHEALCRAARKALEAT